MEHARRARDLRVRVEWRQAQAHRAALQRSGRTVRDRRAVQPRTHGDAVARKLLRQQFAVHIPAADGQHRRLARRIRRRKHLQPGLRAQLRRQALREPPLPPLDMLDALRR